MSRGFSPALVIGVALIAAGPLAAGEAPKKETAKPKEAAKFQPVDIQGMLLETDPPDAMLQGPCRLHRFEFKKGKSYQIDLISIDFDSYLRLEDGEGMELARDDDGGGNLNARLVFNPPADGSYQVVATSLNRAPGKYNLKVSEQGPPAPRVVKALDLGPKGVTVQDKLANNDPVDKTRPNCHSKTYSVKLKAGKSYQIDMKSGGAGIDPYLRFEDANGQVLAQDDDGGGFPNARIVFNCQQEGTYHVVATSFTRAVGDYTLEVRETE